MSSLSHVINLQRRQNSRYNELKKDILNKLTEKINHLAKHGETRCVYSVPLYTFGFPAYQVEDISMYLFLVCRKEGFHTVVLGKDKIFISWDINDINQVKPSKTSKTSKLIDIKYLINNSK